MKFRRDLSDAKITLWVAPEFEDLMKRLSREKAGEAESIKESQNWRNPDGTPLQFYINAKDDVERELLKDCENVRNNYGASLIDREGYGLSANVALVRTKLRNTATDKRIKAIDTWAKGIGLTFGFELEGIFRRGEVLDNVGGDWHEDGSVRTDEKRWIQADGTATESYADEWYTERSKWRGYGDGYNEPICDYCEYTEGSCECDQGFVARDGGSEVTEFASDVYDSFSKAMDDMAKFNDDRYRYNYTCGLHFHVGGNGERSTTEQLENMLCDFSFQKKLLDMARNDMGPVQRERTANVNGFCRFWESAKDLQHTKYQHEKYRFMNFHGNTLEFRFLAPCQQKVENVLLLMEAIRKQLAEPKVIQKTVRAKLPTGTSIIHEKTVKVSDSLHKWTGFTLDGDLLEAYMRLKDDCWTDREMREVVRNFKQDSKSNNPLSWENWMYSLHWHGSLKRDVEKILAIGTILDKKYKSVLERTM
ncbi:unnamed protein product [Sphagnum balticum]